MENVQDLRDEVTSGIVEQTTMRTKINLPDEAKEVTQQTFILNSQQKNSSFCITLLNSKPNANLDSLAQYTIDTARANITNTITLIKSLIASAHDTKAKGHYKSCLGHFKDAIDSAEYSQELLKKRDYLGVNVAASAILTDSEDCISGESPSDPPYNDSSMLTQYAAVVEAVVDILLVIANKLRSSQEEILE
ncbi:unnamed protein product [Sphenostylis stenocarpa]|uniref:Pectinesterase inhibitor domain-containing protein n=1 Tax=Sphenostylis stenocarpa TaxID=92480 RepID=A0AA86ST68_9FABA|nr:unnamed protein product [Sphenostylis stenocarpa]